MCRFFGVPCRVHLLGGESPLHTRQGEGRAEWRLSFKAFDVKAGLDESAGARYRDELYELFADNLYDEDNNQQDNPDPSVSILMMRTRLTGR